MTIGVLVVDDSPSFRAALTLALQSDPAIRVVGQVADGQDAVDLAGQLRPDVVTMDVVMPTMDGIEAARRIMARTPTAIILLTTLARIDEQRLALNALQLGIVDVTNKPHLAGSGREKSTQAMISLVKAAAAARTHSRPEASVSNFAKAWPEGKEFRLIAIAASTGGPPALVRVLKTLGPTAPPVVVAQHLAPSFATTFGSWLEKTCECRVVNVSKPVSLAARTIYIADDGFHLVVKRNQAAAEQAVDEELAPNANRLFHSVARHFAEDALGIVLTGMGSDGANGLKSMQDAGAWTIVQDASDAVVNGMPQAAVKIGACNEILPLIEIGKRLSKL